MGKNLPRKASLLNILHSVERFFMMVASHAESVHEQTAVCPMDCLCLPGFSRSESVGRTEVQSPELAALLRPGQSPLLVSFRAGRPDEPR